LGGSAAKASKKQISGSGGGTAPKSTAMSTCSGMQSLHHAYVMRNCSVWLIVVAAVLSPSNGWSCEPIVPLFQLLSGSSLVGPAMLTESLFWLLLAIALKSGTFICFEKRLPWRQAVWFMFLANVVSTIPGFLLATLTGSGTGMGIVIALPLVFFLGWMVQRRIARLPEADRWPRISGGGAMLAFIGFCIASSILYALAEGVLSARNYQTYWIFKFVFVTLVACTGIIISAVLEECVIAGLSKKSTGNLSFYTPVFRANYITLGAILLVAALKILPKRLHSPNFITTWLDALLTAVGIG
jgi:hypothetical protein